MEYPYVSDLHDTQYNITTEVTSGVAACSSNIMTIIGISRE